MDPIRAAATAAAFELGEPAAAPQFVARGAMGEVWQLRSVDGRRWAVKTLFDWGLADPSGRDVVLQDAAARAGVSLPAPRPALDGRLVVDGVRVYEWADVVPLHRPPDEGTLGEVGRILGVLHALALPPDAGEEVDEWYRTVPTPAELDDLASRSAAADRVWAPALRARLDQLHVLAELVRSAPPRADDVIVCHRDYSPDNVFRPAADGDLVVLDWENAGPLSAEAELANTIAAWCGSSSPQALLAGYAASGGTAEVRGPESFSSNVATRLNYLRVMVDQSLEDDAHRTFADDAVGRLLSVEMDIAVPRGWST